MDNQIQAAKRVASSNPSQENLLKVFHLEAKQGLHPFKNSQEVYEERLKREEKRAKEDQRMKELLEALKTALGDSVGLFKLQNAVANENGNSRPKAFLNFSNKRCLFVSAIHLGNNIGIDVELSERGPRQIPLGNIYTQDDNFPGNIPEKIQAAITLYS